MNTPLDPRATGPRTSDPARNVPLFGVGAVAGRALPVLTNSEMKCFRSCRRRHYLQYRLLYRSLRTAGALRFGTLVHRALEAWWRAREAGHDALAAALAALRTAPDTDAWDLAKAEALLLGYHARWIDEPMEVLDVEVEFKAEIVNPGTGASSRTYVLGGKLDALARLSDGGVYVVEHKTSGEDIAAGSDYWKRLRLDSQVSNYFVGGRALGFDIAGCLYDVIGKPKLQPLEATPIAARKYTKKTGALHANQRDRDETVEEYGARVREHIMANVERYYARGTVVRLGDDERDAAFDTWQTAREIREADLADRHPRNPDACVRYGQTCDFFAVCTHEADLEDPTQYRRAESAHEELGVPAKPWETP